MARQRRMRISLDPEYYFRKIDRARARDMSEANTPPKKIFDYRDYEKPTAPERPDPPKIKKKPGRKRKITSGGAVIRTDHPVIVSFG